MIVTINDLSLLTCFWLVFTRCLTTTFQFPIFDTFTIPMTLKVLFSFSLALIFYPHVKESVFQDMAIVGDYSFWVLTIFYSIIGIIIGMFLKLIMDVFLIGGTLITQNIGLSAIRYFDPTFLQRVGPFELYIQWTMLLIILESKAIIPMFKGVYLSFWGISLHDFYQMKFNYDLIFAFMNSIFKVGVLISIPIMMINLLITLIMGILSRMIPQLNVLMVSFIVNIAVGFIVFSVISNEFFFVCFESYKNLMKDWYLMITI